MCLHPSFGTRICIQNLTSPAKATKAGGAQKAMNSNKLLVGKYQTLARILGDQDFVIEPPMYDLSLKFAIQGV